MAVQQHGWTILFHPLFNERYNTLRAEVEDLRQTLAAEHYRRHPRVKLFVAIYRLIYDVVPHDPDAARFRLHDELGKFRRAKGAGLPQRYRLFWVFSGTQRVIIFLYLNDEATLRKAGATSDPYELFRKLVQQGKIGSDYTKNQEQWLRARGLKEL